MDTQDHKTAATSIGHEGHGVYLCHRCGWPFPKQHPSSKHRRAHKKHCGTIEGYKIIQSEEHDHNLAVSDDEHASDGEHTPSPNLVKENSVGSGRVGDKSNKSEDDVFSDAVTDFADSGISRRLEEHLESVRELNKSMDQKGVEGDLQEGGSLKVDEVAGKNEQSDDPRKREEVPNPEPLVSVTNQTQSALPLTGTSAEEVLGPGPMESGKDSNIPVQEDKLSCVALNSEEGKISEEHLCDNSVSEVVKHDLPSQTEPLEKVDASEEENSVVSSAKRSASYETVEVALADKTQETIDASVGVEGFSQSIKDIRSSSLGEDTLLDESVSTTLSAKPDEGSQNSDTTEHAASFASPIYKEIETKTSSAGGENTKYFDASERELRDMNGKEDQNMELKESSAVDAVPTPDSAVKTIAPEDDQSIMEFKKGADHGEEKSNGKLLETGNDMEGAFVEVKAVLESKKPSDDPTGFPSSFAVESEARNFEELSKEEHGSLESRDGSFEESIQGLDIDGSSGIGSKPNHDVGDVLDKNALPTVSLEVPVSPIISEPKQNIDNGDRVEPVDVAKTISESKEIVSSEDIPEHIIAKESAFLTTEPELLSEHSANNVKASESIDTAGVASKLDHKDDVVSLREISENPLPQVLEASPTSIVSSGELDGDVVASEKCSVTPSLKEPPSDLQAEVDDKMTRESDDRSNSSSSRSDSLEANCGSVVSDTLETNSQKQQAEGARSDKSDTFEPPSFMTLVQPGGEGEEVKGAKEIETEENKAGWFPSIKNVVNESEGRKKNEEIIAKVTNWSPAKQQHGPLKSLLNEVKSPNTKQVSASYQKIETETEDNNRSASTVGSVIAPENKDKDTKKDVEEWNSPARYPIEIKKEKKKKGRSYWVPFVCCSSVHRDL